MEKSGLYIDPGVHRLDETRGWVMAASVLRPCQRAVRGERGARPALLWTLGRLGRGDLVRTGND